MLKTAINIADEIKKPGKITKAELKYFPEDLSLCGRQLVPDNGIDISVSYGYDGENGLNIAGKISAVFHEECSRCGKAFLMPFECEFSELFVRLGNDSIVSEDTDSYTFTGDVVELSDFINEMILLNYPMTSLCNENCKGLCPECGCNLNEKQCDCGEEKEDIDPNSDDAFDKAMELLKSKYSIK